MTSYELYDQQDVLKARVTIDDQGQAAWDFSMNALGVLWLSEEDRADLVKFIAHFEVHAPHEPGFVTKGKGYTVRRVPAP